MAEHAFSRTYLMELQLTYGLLAQVSTQQYRALVSTLTIQSCSSSKGTLVPRLVHLVWPQEL